MANIILQSVNFSQVLATRLFGLGSGWQVRGVDSLGAAVTDVKTFSWNQSGSALSNALDIVFSPAASEGNLCEFEVFRPADVIGTNDPYLLVTPDDGICGSGGPNITTGSVVRIPAGELKFDFNNAVACSPDEGGWTSVSGEDAITNEILTCGTLYVDVSQSTAFSGVAPQVVTLVGVGSPANVLENTSTHTFVATANGTLSQVFVSCGTGSSNMLFLMTFDDPISLTIGQSYTINPSDISITFNG